MFANRQNILVVSLIMITASLFYLSFRSIQWDQNGIIEAMSIRNGGRSLFSPNHMLFRPMGAFIVNIFQVMNFPIRLEILLQYVTSIISGICVGLFYILVSKISENTFSGLLATLLFTVSWSFWIYSTDIHYISSSVLFIILALIMILSPGISLVKILLIGLISVIAILFYQSNIFILPFIVLGFFINNSNNNSYKSISKYVLLYLVVVIFLLISTYLFVAVEEIGLKNRTEIINWLFSHGNDRGGRVFLWGQWSFDRVPSLFITFISSFIPLWEGLGLRALFQLNFNWNKLLGQFSLIAFVTLLTISLIFFFKQIKENKLNRKLLLLFSIGFLSYMPFLLWWDPFEPRWFIIPNIFLISILAMIWKNVRNPFTYFIIGTCILTIGIANFNMSIFRRHTQPNKNLMLAKCISENINSNDLFIVTEWDWFVNARYFFGFPANSIELIGSKSSEEKLMIVREGIKNTKLHGGHVFMRDWASIAEDERHFFESLINMRWNEFNEFDFEYAFSCKEYKFVEFR